MSLSTEDIDALLQQSQTTFERELPQLMEESRNLWVGYWGSKRLGSPADDPEEFSGRCSAEGLDASALAVFKIQPDIQPARKTW